MASAIHELQSLTIQTTAEDRQNKCHGPCTPESRSPSLRRNNRLQDRCENSHTPLHDPGPPPQNVHRKSKLVRDPGSALVASLWACTKNKDLRRGTRLHEDILQKGLLDACSGALVTMYAKCGALSTAQALLDAHTIRDVVPWTAVIAGYVREQRTHNAFECFERMQHHGVSPNGVTYACILKACGTVGDADKGKQIHDEITRQGLLRNDIVLGNALVDMYAKSGALAKACGVLEELPSRDVISWNTLISGYAQQGQGEQALNCFEQMQSERISPTAVTYTSVLKACGALGEIDKGTQIHEEIVARGLLQNDVVLGNALVDMYAKCGALSKAHCVLAELPSRDVISWNTLITGYAQQSQGEQALQCFERMQSEGLRPNAVTFASILKACGSLGAADKGEQIHDEVMKQGLLQNNIVLGGALVDMYAKCGALAKAHCVLEELPSRDVISWSALIAGYAQQGQGEQAMECFERMQREGTPPNAATLCSMLNVCSHLGLVEEGHMLFVNMSSKYGVKPDLEMYACMIDLYGRAGHLERAVRLIREMPTSNYAAIWHALLGACLRWGEVDIGRWAFEQALQVDKKDGAIYVLMANIFAAAGMQESVRSIEAMSNKAGCRRWTGFSRDLHGLSVVDT